MILNYVLVCVFSSIDEFLQSQTKRLWALTQLHKNTQWQQFSSLVFCYNEMKPTWNTLTYMTDNQYHNRVIRAKRKQWRGVWPQNHRKTQTRERVKTRGAEDTHLSPDVIRFHTLIGSRGPSVKTPRDWTNTADEKAEDEFTFTSERKRK